MGMLMPAPEFVGLITAKLLTSDHRQVQALLFGALDSNVVTGIGMAHHAGGRVVVQYAGDALGGFVRAVADDQPSPEVLRKCP